MAKSAAATLEDLVDYCHGNIWHDYKRDVKNPALSDALKQLHDEVIEGLNALRQNEHPTENGVPVETYGYEATHNEALDKAIKFIGEYFGKDNGRVDG